MNRGLDGDGTEAIGHVLGHNQFPDHGTTFAGSRWGEEPKKNRWKPIYTGPLTLHWHIARTRAPFGRTPIILTSFGSITPDIRHMSTIGNPQNILTDVAGPSKSTAASLVPPVQSRSQLAKMVRPPRTLVLCFDGTANQYDGYNTNVVKFFSLLKKDNIDEQMCYYQAGIGTYFQPGVVSPFFQWGAKILDEAVAWYLPAHVMDGYKFLMQNWNTGDKVCLFGFSRGAYTARALAGMLFKVGLLPRDNEEQVPFAYKLYASNKTSDADLAAGFKLTFCRDVPIEFVGVWDTVASVGIIMTKSLPFVSTNTAIRTFRHALSLDEHRAKFRPNLYHRPDPPTSSARTRALPGQALLRALDSAAAGVRQDLNEGERKLETALGYGDGEGTPSDASASSPSTGWTTDVDEVWFSGCHSDIGGGAVSDSTENALANIPLRWMVREVMLAQCGIVFGDTALMRWNVPLTATSAFKANRAGDAGKEKVQMKVDEYMGPDAKISEEVDSGNVSESGNEGGEGRKGKGLVQTKTQTSSGEGEGDASTVSKDAIQPMDDELKKMPLWWILEIIPTKYSWQDATGKWVDDWSIHLGRGRWVPDQPKFHESVKIRISDASLKYTPRARYAKGTEIYVK
ncbi:hypothetical protein EW146_g3969 [Bondarzewia mesenterica]|uniref:T6SS Phospholipase effector Tle1-like catalytic domain-containing protein n=1 Tax=Bondarzewia mesenterica TaxID=1095465 RepID=A0A4S4LXT2_9AGAM|nr:hypothetical protein EW146_g3969 [Bondarzewia mesenterica]